MQFSITGQEKGDLLIQVTVWTDFFLKSLYKVFINKLLGEKNPAEAKNLFHFEKKCPIFPLILFVYI